MYVDNKQDDLQEFDFALSEDPYGGTIDLTDTDFGSDIPLSQDDSHLEPLTCLITLYSKRYSQDKTQSSPAGAPTKPQESPKIASGYAKNFVVYMYVLSQPALHHMGG